MPAYMAQRGCDIRMEASDILIHKGEKEEKYKLYVEDYVMSYLKNYRTTDRINFFYGERKPRENKYYIYGAGRQKQISYFEKYELLDEITCRYVMDMPVFSVRESSGTYELKGYYIFYQSNDAMQSYMVEQRKNVESKEKAEEKRRPIAVVSRRDNNELSKAGNPVRTQFREKKQEKSGNGLMAIQLSAIFIIIAAIAINSTNSYTKLKELGQSAVEVFFVLENQDAAEDGEGVAVVDETPKETVLRLTDLDKKFEEENNTAKLEEDKDVDKSEADAQESESAETIDESNDVKEASASSEVLTSDQAFSRNITEYYRIEKGDTLYTISIKIYGDSSKVAEICELNQITNPDHIEYGQRILLP